MINRKVSVSWVLFLFIPMLAFGQAALQTTWTESQILRWVHIGLIAAEVVLGFLGSEALPDGDSVRFLLFHDPN